MLTEAIKWTDENGRETTIEDYILEMMEENGMLDPVGIVVDCPYAESFEYGTRPFRFSTKGVFYKNMRKWVAKQYQLRALEAILHGDIPLSRRDEKKEVDRATYMICSDIATDGMRPHPFFRGAVYKVMSQKLENLITETFSMSDVADMIIEEMRNILTYNNSVYSGELISSIHKIDARAADAESTPDYLWSRRENYLGYGPREDWADILPAEWEEWSWQQRRT